MKATERFPARQVVSSRVAAIRTAVGLTRTELAKAAGISRNSLFLIEARAANTRLDTVTRLAVALDVDICCLLSIENDILKPRRRPKGIRATLSTNLAHLRQELSLSQEGLNRLCGFVRGYVWVLEGTDQDVSIDTLDAIANALNVSLAALFENPNK
ncbi:helix-turn-helix domain-containing protein [Burkholderia sp. PU8-34]